MSAAEMDRIYRYQRLIYDVTRRYYLLGRTRLQRDLAPPDGGRVLEIGCGTAWNLISAARAYPNATFHGLDVSAEMLKTARRSVAKAALDHRIALAEADATAFDCRALFGVEGFDRVFISYALSMIPAWRDVLENAAGVLAPSGTLHVVDFGRCERLPGAFRSALHAWLDRFHVHPREDMSEALERLAETHGLTLAFESLHGGYAVLARMAAPARAPAGTAALDAEPA